jgi:hypothetical protein
MLHGLRPFYSWEAMGSGLATLQMDGNSFDMPRKPRKYAPWAVYHVILRGNAGQDIFADERDRFRQDVFLTDVDRYRFYLLLQ